MGNSLLKTISFSNLKEWSVFDSFVPELNAKYPTRKLGEYLRLVKEPIYIDNKTLYKQVRVKTRGQGVVKRKELYGSEIGTKKQFIAHKQNLIISKIDARNGAFGIIPHDLEGAIITASFLQYKVIGATIEYISLVLSLDILREQWQALSSGTTNRQSVNEDKVESFMIPMPSILEQEEILRAYHATLAEADKNMSEGDNFCNNLLYDIQAMVSDLKKEEHNLDSSTSIMKIIPFTSTKRWEVDYILKEGCLENIYESFKYKSYSISDLQTESLFGLSVKASLEQKKGMIPVLRMSNVINGEIDYTELKYLPLKCAVTSKEPDKWLLKDGDFLITRTNGSKDLVGKAAVFHSNDIYTYASYLIRYRFNTSIILPEYVNIMFMTPIVREQIAVMRRQGGGQYNLNSDEIGSIRIPVPPISVQKNIIEKYYSTKDGANTYYDRANELRNKAATDFEKSIFL